VRDLRTHFFTDEGVVKAVDGVSFELGRGETLGIVGESGCGKSVTALSIMRLVPDPPGRIVGGSVSLNGRDVTACSEAEMRKIRGNTLAMIFQDPLTAMNPVFSIGSQVMEPIRAHARLSRKEAWPRAAEALRTVGIPQPEQRMKEYPHQFSGGMRQRAMIAMALAARDPAVLIADEPTTALDVTIQAQILGLMKRLQEERGSGIILITHDLGVVAQTAHRVMVMYAGKVVEHAATRKIFYEPLHPYTWGLLRSLPRLDQLPGSNLTSIPGSPPSLIDLPGGCSYHPRCPFVMARCLSEEPALEEKADGHLAACLLSRERFAAARRESSRAG